MGNSNQSCNQCSCQSSPSSSRKSSKSYTDCCTETTCITIETTGNVGLGTTEPAANLFIIDSCNTDSCNTDIQTKRSERLSRRRSRRGR